MATKERLRAWLAEHPNACIDHSLSDLGKQFGVSRERIRQLLPRTSYVRNFRGKAKLGRARSLIIAKQFLIDHPEVTIPVTDGGWSFKHIIREAGVTEHYIKWAWHELELPNRAELRKATPYSDHLIRHWETCRICDRLFPVTVRIEQNRKRRTKYRVCSLQCGVICRDQKLTPDFGSVPERG